MSNVTTSADQQPVWHHRRGHVQRDLVRARSVRDGVLDISRSRARHAVAVIEVMGTNFTLRSADDREGLVAGYQALLKAIPPGQSVQILLRRTARNLSNYIGRMRAIERNETTHPTDRALAAAHAEHIERLGRERALFNTRCYLIVPAQNAGRVSPIERLLKRHAVQERSHEAIHAELAIQSERHLSQLAGMGLAAQRLDDDALIRLVASCLAPANAERYPLATATIDSAMPPVRFALPDLIAPSAVLEQPAYLSVDGEYLRGIAITGYPREVGAGWLAPILAHDDGFDLSLHIHALHPGAVVQRYRRRTAEIRASKRLAARKGWVENPDEAVAAGDIERLLTQVASRAEALCSVGLYLLVRAPDRAGLDERTDRLMAVLHQSFLVAHPTTFEHLRAWQAMQPLADDPLRRSVLLDTKSLATAFPFISNALSMPHGVLEGVTASGEPVIIDDWAEELDNPHRFIGAVTGAGKSYACKLHIMRELLVRADEDIQIAVIDPEQEYQRTCREFSGTNVRLAPGSEQHLNPFDVIPQGMDLTAYLADRVRGDRLAEKVQALHALYDLMLSDRGPTGVMALSVREKGLLDRATYEVYRRAGITADPATHGRPAPILPDLYQVLASGAAGKDEYGLSDRLYRYVEGSLAGMFSAPTDVALDNRLVIFDIRDMSGDLRPIGILLIAESMWTQVFAAKRPRVLYIDEAWSLIQHPEGGRFLADLARRARKHYLRLVTITQSPELFIDDPHGAVIAGNAATKLLKKQDRTSAPVVASRFGLTAAERQTLLGLRKPEALLLVGGQRVVVTVEANPLEHRLATTNPRELAELERDPLRKERL